MREGGIINFFPLLSAPLKAWGRIRWERMMAKRKIEKRESERERKRERVRERERDGGEDFPVTPP